MLQRVSPRSHCMGLVPRHPAERPSPWLAICIPRPWLAHPLPVQTATTPRDPMLCRHALPKQGLASMCLEPLAQDYGAHKRLTLCNPKPTLDLDSDPIPPRL